MVSVLLWIVLMFIVKICQSLRCVEQVQVVFSSSEFTLSKIETVLARLEHHHRHICSVYMELDHIAETLVLKFDQSMVTLPHLRSVENGYVSIDTSIILANADQNIYQASIKTRLHLKCYSGDNCDIQLVFEYLSYLMKTDFRQIQSSIQSLISMEEDPMVACTIGERNNLDLCFNTSCSWYYSTDTVSGVGTCEDIDSNGLPRVDITTEIRMYTKPLREGKGKLNRAVFKYASSIQFWCQFNNCNNHNIGTQIKDIVSEQYGLWTMNKMYQLK